MARFAWNPDWETGNAMIDAQHRQLVALANLLDAAVKMNKENEVVAEAFQALVDYTYKHFTEEEDYFNNIHSTLLREHRKAHAELREELEIMLDTGAPVITESLGKDLEVWVETRLIPHMTEDDQKAVEAVG